MKSLHILRIQCADRKGLIAAITGELFRRQLNIEAMKEFVEPVSDTFFARLEISGQLVQQEVQQSLEAVLPEGAWVSLHQQQPKSLVVMVTREYHCLGDLLLRNHFGGWPASIKAVIGNHQRLQEMAEKFDIPFYYISHEQKDKAVYEQEMLQLLDALQPDYIVLAKYMRILSPGFVARFPHRIINIHHSFLPAFVGASPYRQAYERGVKLIGATAHFVTDDLDEGPIITQKVIAADHEYNVDGMVQAGHEVERSVLADALKLVLEDRVFVIRNRTIIFD